jgi:hypothetical protein
MIPSNVKVFLASHPIDFQRFQYLTIVFSKLAKGTALEQGSTPGITLAFLRRVIRFFSNVFLYDLPSPRVPAHCHCLCHER